MIYLTKNIYKWLNIYQQRSKIIINATMDYNVSSCSTWRRFCGDSITTICKPMAHSACSWKKQQFHTFQLPPLFNWNPNSSDPFQLSFVYILFNESDSCSASIRPGTVCEWLMYFALLACHANHSGWPWQYPPFVFRPSKTQIVALIFTRPRISRRLHIFSGEYSI